MAEGRMVTDGMRKRISCLLEYCNGVLKVFVDAKVCIEVLKKINAEGAEE